jgi:aryl-alcohol dehydrogenase-like predicted oxidoreductase
VTAFSGLARGWLSGSKKIRSETDINFINMYGDALDLEIIDRVQSIAERRDTTMAEIALAWLCSKNDICCPILGASSVSQVENNIKALEIDLSEGEIVALDQMYRPRDMINDYIPEPLPRYLESK